MNCRINCLLSPLVYLLALCWVTNATNECFAQSFSRDSGDILVRSGADITLGDATPRLCFPMHGNAGWSAVGNLVYDDCNQQGCLGMAQSDAIASFLTSPTRLQLLLTNDTECAVTYGKAVVGADLHNGVVFRVTGGDPNKDYFRIRLKYAIVGDVSYIGEGIALNYDVEAVAYTDSEHTSWYVPYLCSDCEGSQNCYDFDASRLSGTYHEHFLDNGQEVMDTSSGQVNLYEFNYVTPDWEELDSSNDCFEKGEEIRLGTKIQLDFSGIGAGEELHVSEGGLKFVLYIDVVEYEECP